MQQQIENVYVATPPSLRAHVDIQLSGAFPLVNEESYRLAIGGAYKCGPIIATDSNS